MTGIRIAHMGDLGCELPKERERNAERFGCFNDTGGEAITRLMRAQAVNWWVRDPNVVIPMHYRGMGFGFDVLGSVNEYLGLCQNVVRYQNVIEITKDMPETDCGNDHFNNGNLQAPRTGYRHQ